MSKKPHGKRTATPKRSVQLSIEEIVARDVKHNHAGSGLTYDEAITTLAGLIEDGSQLIRVKNTLFLYDEMPDQGVEFHAINADSADQLVRNLAMFFAHLKSLQVPYAKATFANPKNAAVLETVSKLFSNKVFRTSTKRIAMEGDDQYETTVEI
jgi:hypothetical protein